MATVAATESRRSGRSRKALAPVPDNDANISAGGADLAAALPPQPHKAKRTSPKMRKAEVSPIADERKGTPPALVDADAVSLGKADVATAPASTRKVKRASSKGGGKAKAAAPSMTDELTELQGMLERLRLEKEKAEEMVRERDEVIRKKEEELETRGKQQERLQAELKKMQRVKVFEPTMNFPLAQSLLGKDHEEEGDKGKKKKKGKGKAGNERKKPAPAYILWCKDQWAEIKKSPDADFKEVTNALGAKWKTLSNEEKQPYEERYRQEKEAYLQVVGQEKREAEAMKLLDEEQMRWTAKELLGQYLKFRQEAEGDGNSKKAKNKRKKEKDPSKPKQPMSAYFLYSQERRAALVAEKKTVPEIGKITGEEWKRMTEAQKAPYEEAARKQKEAYQKQMEVYNQKKLEEMRKKRSRRRSSSRRLCSFSGRRRRQTTSSRKPKRSVRRRSSRTPTRTGPRSRPLPSCSSARRRGSSWRRSGPG
ncbi:HMG1/2-like protein [Hordeum vulgare]|nr:HMG1/2-like protein [Hordeum vulgare]